MRHLTAKPLARDQMEQLIQRKVDWILKSSHPEKIILVGSAARFEMDESSDIDLIVIYSSVEEVKVSKAPLYSSRPKNDWPHDLFLIDKDVYQRGIDSGGGVFWLADREGKVLFERRK